MTATHTGKKLILFWTVEEDSQTDEMHFFTCFDLNKLEAAMDELKRLAAELPRGSGKWKTSVEVRVELPSPLWEYGFLKEEPVFENGPLGEALDKLASVVGEKEAEKARHELKEGNPFYKEPGYVHWHLVFAGDTKRLPHGRVYLKATHWDNAFTILVPWSLLHFLED